MCLKNYVFQIQVNVFQTLLCVEMFCDLMYCLVPYVTTLYYIVLYSINYKNRYFDGLYVASCPKLHKTILY